MTPTEPDMTDETEDYSDLPENIQASLAARKAKAAAMSLLSPAQREDQWIKEQYTKVVGICVRNGRRTIKGWVQNTKHTSIAKKQTLVNKLQELVNELQASIPTEKPAADDSGTAPALLNPFE